MDGSAYAAEWFVFLKFCISEAISLCPQAWSTSICSWIWMRSSSSAALCWISGLVCSSAAHRELWVDGHCWLPVVQKFMETHRTRGLGGEGRRMMVRRTMRMKISPALGGNQFNSTTFLSP